MKRCEDSCSFKHTALLQSEYNIKYAKKRVGMNSYRHETDVIHVVTTPEILIRAIKEYQFSDGWEHNRGHILQFL
jgi:hypothetical protein